MERASEITVTKRDPANWQSRICKGSNAIVTGGIRFSLRIRLSHSRRIPSVPGSSLL
jgi:hypothetical protein